MNVAGRRLQSEKCPFLEIPVDERCHGPCLAMPRSWSLWRHLPRHFCRSAISEDDYDRDRQVSDHDRHSHIDTGQRQDRGRHRYRSISL